MRGILLAGGLGQRLYPLTKTISKQLMPVYDKPLIYYSLSILMIAGIRDIMLISNKDQIPTFKKLLKDGKHIGVNICYEAQEKPNGIAESFIIAENFIKNHNVCLVLGDNIFFGQGLKNKLNSAMKRKSGATIFSYKVRNPSQFGVVTFNKKNKVLSIEEKPKNPKSNNAVTGLYFYDKKVLEIAKSITPSQRGELEITDINKQYLKSNNLYVEDFGRGFAWLDTGTHDSLLEAGQFVQIIENRQNLKIACIEEIACRNGWITTQEIINIAKSLDKTQYGEYLFQVSQLIEKDNK